MSRATIEHDEESLVQDERGFTIIELLTGLLLFGMVTAILYSFLFLGVSMYQRVTVETQLRNQSDALYSRIITELKDAVYVKQGASNREIVYVKRNTDPKIYVDVYRMVIEQDGAAGPMGISVYRPGSATPKRYELTDQFTMDLAQSALKAPQQNIVEVQLRFARSDAAAVQEAKRADLEIRSKIPLFRME